MARRQTWTVYTFEIFTKAEPEDTFGLIEEVENAFLRRIPEESHKHVETLMIMTPGIEKKGRRM